MVVLTRDDLEAMKQPMGSPCPVPWCEDQCGDHFVVTWWRTPARYAVQRTEHRQGQTGIWWVMRDRKRYVKDEAAAIALATEWES